MESSGALLRFGFPTWIGRSYLDKDFFGFCYFYKEVVVGLVYEL